mmetsp:Transcript_16082/g.36700  ORF Transcript_16082/g.36700 Transcript_16082/m.36700 type:complete len:515 (-) Transcript_16082:104-1648(-)
MEELSSGLVHGPFSVNDLNAKAGTWKYAFGFGLWRPLPRFAIWQGSKYRCIDDASASGSNALGTWTHETICCDRPDSPARIGIRFHRLGVPPCGRVASVRMGGGTDDAFAAYRRVPTADAGYTVVMLAVPDGDRFVAKCFCLPGHNFGLVSSVLNFNCIPEPLVAFSRRYFATPVTRFYDDEGVHEPLYGQGSAQWAHFQLREILRFHFDFGKHVPWSPKPVYCGVCTDWSLEARGVVRVGVTTKRRETLVGRIDELVARGECTGAEASSLYGKARWCLSPMFGRFGVALLRPLKLRQYAIDGASTLLGDELRDSLLVLRALVSSSVVFSIPIFPDSSPHVVVLSDASFERGYGWLGFVIASPFDGVFWAGAPTPAWMLRLLTEHRVRGTYIGQLEALAALSAYLSLPQIFRSRKVSHYIDNQAALYSLIKGSSADVDMNRVAFLIRAFYVRFRVDAWLDYVPSASNIADLPTRLDDAALLRLNNVGVRIPLVLPSATDLSSSWCALLCAILDR